MGGDALQLTAELLKIFVIGELDPPQRDLVPEGPAGGVSLCPLPAEAAIRSVRQAQAEDLAQVDVEQLEKVLPQLVSEWSRVPTPTAAQP